MTGPALALAAALAGVVPAATAAQDAALLQALQGVWCNSNDGGRTCWAYDEFFADGSFAACGRTDDDPRPFRGGGPASVSGRRMRNTVAFASDNFWLRPGGRYCTDILSIDARTHRYRDIDTQQEFTLHRVAHGATRCPADNTP